MPLHIHVDLSFMACSGLRALVPIRAQAKSYPKSADSARLGPTTVSQVLQSRFLHGRHRHAGNLDLEHAEARARAEVDGLPVVAAEGDVRRIIEAVHDAAEPLALGVHDVEPARTAAVDVAGGIDLHAV